MFIDNDCSYHVRQFVKRGPWNLNRCSRRTGRAALIYKDLAIASQTCEHVLTTSHLNHPIESKYMTLRVQFLDIDFASECHPFTFLPVSAIVWFAWWAVFHMFVASIATSPLAFCLPWLAWALLTNPFLPQVILFLTHLDEITIRFFDCIAPPRWLTRLALWPQVPSSLEDAVRMYSLHFLTRSRANANTVRCMRWKLSWSKIHRQC